MSVAILMQILRQNGFNPTLKATPDPDIEDDSIEITPEVHIQVCSLSGNAVAVTRKVGDLIEFNDVQHERQMLPILRQVLAKK